MISRDVATRPLAVAIGDERQLRNILAGHVRHYNSHRPYQVLQQRPALQRAGYAVDITARIERRQVLSSLISEARSPA